MDGWIILDKPSDIFSRTASSRVAKMFATKKVGHIGTLDPMASGVLPIAIGNATKMIPFIENISDDKKEYTFSMQFGFETDTLDISGKTIKTIENIPNNIDTIKDTLHSFIGEKLQIPPIFSAIHVNGVRAYKIAREGKELDIPERKINIFELDFLEKVDKSYHFRVLCSRGTYVRSIARDIAYKLGTFGTVDMIRRLHTTGFDIKNTVKLDFLENLFNNGGDINNFLMPLDFGLGDIPVLNLDDKSAKLYKNGGFIETNVPNGMFRIYSAEQFIGIGIVNNKVLCPKRTI